MLFRSTGVGAEEEKRGDSFADREREGGRRQREKGASLTFIFTPADLAADRVDLFITGSTSSGCCERERDRDIHMREREGERQRYTRERGREREIYTRERGREKET